MNTLQTAIKANIDVLADMLEDAYRVADEALTAINKCEQNQAIGTLMALEGKLESIPAIYKATMTLHRESR
jgi:hypothetical protein